MIIRAWRITKTIFAPNAFSGKGAAEWGGRWNSPRTPVVYTAQSISLGCLEVLVGGVTVRHLVKRYSKIPVEFDNSFVTPISSLPKDWNVFPAPVEDQRVGDLWAGKKASLVLKVPSSIVDGEFNYIINPLHPDATNLKIGPSEGISIDMRLIGLFTPPVTSSGR